jgi:hypothetical protein
LGHPNGICNVIQLIGHCPKLLMLSLAYNIVESSSDSIKIRKSISSEIGVKPHYLTREIWKVPATNLNCLDIRGCNIFCHTGSLRNTLEDIERCQEIKYFFKCLSNIYNIEINGSNTKFPLHWENRSPADVALQIMKKHNISPSSWKNKKTELFQLLKQWTYGMGILLHEENGDSDGVEMETIARQ